jgi:hypothetical protein
MPATTQRIGLTPQRTGRMVRRLFSQTGIHATPMTHHRFHNFGAPAACQGTARFERIGWLRSSVGLSLCPDVATTGIATYPQGAATP